MTSRPLSVPLATAAVLLAAPLAFAQPKPALTPDKEGFCQQTDFVAWSKDGGEAAWSESYCAQPPPDAAYDTLYLANRDGSIRRWLIGSEAAASMKVDTRAKLLYGEYFRKEGATSPDGKLKANARIEGDYLLVTFATANKEEKAPAPVSKEVRLPYRKWENAKPPKVSEIYWSPDSGALAVVVRGEKKEPGGGKLGVGSVYLHQIKPLPKPQPMAKPVPQPVPAPKPMPAPAPMPTPTPKKAN